MKAYLLQVPLLITAWLIGNAASAQNLAPDQNPDYAVTRDKYMKIADSVNAWHSTTAQDTYKAIDWLADKQEARADRRQFRRELRRQRASSYGYYNNYDYNGYYYRNNYRRNYYQPNYRRNRISNFWWTPWCF